MLPSDTEEAPRDDAPPTTAKDLDGDRELIARAVTINRPVAEVYAYFRDFANLPTFMENVVRIDVLDATRSHWVVRRRPGARSSGTRSSPRSARTGRSPGSPTRARTCPIRGG